MIELNHVTIVAEGIRIIEDLSLAIQSNSMTLLISSNEQITKNVIHAICGLKPIDSGRIDIDRVRVPSDVIRKKMICALETPAMNPTLTPRQNLKYYLALRGIQRPIIDELDVFAERLLLHEFLDTRVADLGTGHLRGFETLLALIVKPDYFIQSDFTASFFAPYFTRVPSELDALLKGGSCIVSSTPSFKFARSLAIHLPIRVALISQTGLVIEGPIDRVVDRHTKESLYLPETDLGQHKSLEIERAIKALPDNTK
jgi:ABC-type multidrug transport system ATPase subunit